MRSEPRAAKVKIVEELKTKIDSSRLVILTDYKGMTVAQITSMRKELKKQGAEFKVVKNSLMAKALELLDKKEMIEYLEGALGVAFAQEDPVMPTKIIYKYLKEFSLPKVKGGLLNKETFDEKKLERLSKLPSKEVLIGKVVGGIASPLYGLVNVLQGNIRKLVYVLDAVKGTKKE